MKEYCFKNPIYFFCPTKLIFSIKLLNCFIFQNPSRIQGAMFSMTDLRSMGNSQVMPKVDFSKEDLKTAHMYSKYVEAKNFERYTLARAGIRRKRIIFAASTIFIVSVYSYTIFKIRQETFLDDFDEPETVNN